MSESSEAGKKRGLGRGLSALMDDVGMDTILDDENVQDQDVTTTETQKEHQAASKGEMTSVPTKTITYVAMDQLTRNPDQPRRYFDTHLLEELSASIKDKGV